jgi:hypothetical protein
MVPPVPWLYPAKVDVSNLHIGYCTDNGFFPARPPASRGQACTR